MFELTPNPRTFKTLSLGSLLLFAASCSTPPKPKPLPKPPQHDTLEQRSVRGVEKAASSESSSFVLHGATILTAVGKRFESGFVVVDKGRIQAVGEGAPPHVEGATVLDASGTFITPGLIDTHSHLGVYPSPHARAHSDGNEATRPVTAGVWAEHSFWPQDPGIEQAVAGGVTAMQVLPGSANLVGGRGVVLQMVPQRGSRAMRFPGAPETIKMACGENPKRVYKDQGPSTRMGNLQQQRQAFAKATEYKRKWDLYAHKLKSKSKKAEPPTRNIHMDTLSGVLQGKILPQVHCYRADDMLSFLQLADEFGFKIRSFHHALEAYKIRDILSEKEVAASTWADWWGFKMEAFDGIPENAAMLSAAGGISIIHSDSSEGIQRLNQEAAKAYYSGTRAGFELSENDALRWITANPAWALGIDKEVGTLEAGKRADLVVWDAHPFSVYAATRWVFINGALRYDRKQKHEPWSDFEAGWEVQP